MSQKITIIGVYPMSDNEDVHLIEATINVPASQFDVGDFTQEIPSEPEENWQVAYDEHYLNQTGTQVIGDFISKPTDEEEITRLAFFLYFVNFAQPLQTPFGSVPLPKPRSMPERLTKIIEFEDAD